MIKIKKIIHTILSRLKDKYKGEISKDFRHNVEIYKDGCLAINLSIPESSVRIRIDIGLSHNAPNSMKWLEENPDVVVIGIEANKYNIEELLLKSERRAEKKINNIKERFKLLYCAIDDTKIPKYANFYHVTGDSGTSSLLTPTEELLKKNLYKIKEISEIPVVSLSDILNIINWTKINYIEVCKVDTQGKDLDVILSAKEYLGKIAVVIAEVNTWGQYEGAADASNITRHMTENGFSIHKYIYAQNGDPSDIIYVNKKLAKEARSFLSELD